MTLRAPQKAASHHDGAPPRHRHRRPLAAASLLLLLAGLNLGAVLAIGLTRLRLDVADPGGLALWGGRLTGLLAEVLVLAQILLAARVPWLEKAVGQDRLLRWHRNIAPLALVALVAHPLLLALSAANQHLGGVGGELLSLGGAYLDATVGLGLFLALSAVSVRAVRQWMPYEGWYVLHLTAYVAVALAFGHQLGAGSTVLHGPLVRSWWMAQLALTLGAVVVYRFGLPLKLALRHRVRVTKVVRESDDVVSVHMTGHGLDELGAQGGQFMVWRFLTLRDWWRSHPYSLSAAPRDGLLRLTAREIGEGSRMLARLKPGTRVLAEGPYGVLTDAVRTRPEVLLIGAGLGISPIRALLEDMPCEVDVEVVHRASTRDAAVLHHELEALAAGRPLTRVHLVTGRRGRPDDRLRPLGPLHLRSLVPDITSRDVYVCGPPGLTAGIIENLRRLGVPGSQVHLESFEL
jgi:predicted ferric reductase